jgi:hypothetical protein
MRRMPQRSGCALWHRPCPGLREQTGHGPGIAPCLTIAVPWPYGPWSTGVSIITRARTLQVNSAAPPLVMVPACQRLCNTTRLSLGSGCPIEGHETAAASRHDSSTSPSSAVRVLTEAADKGHVILRRLGALCHTRAAHSVNPAGMHAPRPTQRIPSRIKRPYG